MCASGAAGTAQLVLLMAQLLINYRAAVVFLRCRVESSHVSPSAPRLRYKCLMSCLCRSPACRSSPSSRTCSAFNSSHFKCIRFSWRWWELSCLVNSSRVWPWAQGRASQQVCRSVQKRAGVCRKNAGVCRSVQEEGRKKAGSMLEVYR